MLKRFFVSFAASLSAIWLSIILFFVLIVCLVVSAAISGSDFNTSKLEPHSVLYLNLNGTIDERPAAPNLTEFIQSEGKAQSSAGLNNIVMAIKAAADDKNIDGIFIDANGATAGIATRFSIIDAIKEFKKSGKWVIAYGDSYAQGDYIIASAADSILVNPQGMINVNGLSATTVFFKGLLDKIGVEMQIFKVGTYKSAVEPFMLTQMSEASREQQEAYINGIWATITAQIGKARGVSAATVNAWADSICSTWETPRLVNAKIADRAVYRHEVDELLARLTDNDDVDDVNYLTPQEYVTLKGLPKNKGDKKIAVLYAVGDIVDSGKGGIVATDMVPEIEDIIDDDDVAGLILRVNSGGGSAFASEQIWEALERFKATGRPLYVSMGDVAASGGYYISCGAKQIYAQPQTLTGSIGIFGMIPCAKNLMTDKLGLNTGTVCTNPNGLNISIMEPLNPDQSAAMQRMISNGYETFVSRCAKGRKKTVAQIKAIAEGRVWDGQQALKIGLVDKLGTLDDCIAAMAKELKLKKYKLQQLPSQSSSLWEQVLSMNAQMREKHLRESLGEAYNWYRSIDEISNMCPIQARMEYVIIQ